MRKPYLSTFFSTFFYIGKIPFAPGTWGSLAAFPIGYGILLSTQDIWTIFAVTTILLFLFGTFVTYKYVTATGREDPKEVVIDEVVGQLIAIGMLTFYTSDDSLPGIMHTFFSYTINVVPIAIGFLAFLLFRLFDITKLWPVSWFDEQMEGAWGVMLDDVAAGILAGLAGMTFIGGVTRYLG